MPQNVSITWTALPKSVTSVGSDTVVLAFTAFISHRLQGTEDTLGPYELGNWPEEIARLVSASAFKVRFASPTGRSYPAVVDTSRLNPALWDTLFTDATLVKPYEFQDNTIRPIRSFSVKAINDYVDELYELAGATPDQFPSARGFDLFGSMLNNGVLRATGYKQLLKSPASAGPHPDRDAEAAAPSGGSVPEIAYLNAYRFYRRHSVAPLFIPPEKEPLDFHDVIAGMGDHPELLYRLGVCVDFEVAVDRGDFDLDDRVSLEVSGTGATALRPWTRYECFLEKQVFSAKPRADSDIRRGMLKLDDESRFFLYHGDTDGTVLKTFDFMTTLTRGVHHNSLLPPPARIHAAVDVSQVIGLTSDYESPEKTPRYSLPALRSGALTIARQDRDQEIWNQFKTQTALNVKFTGEPALGTAGPLTDELYAEDVARGYRIDVREEGRGQNPTGDGIWRSLCERVGEHRIGSAGDPALPFQNEGYVKASSGTSVSPDSHSHEEPADHATNDPHDDGIYVHEAVCGWDNWSLVAPRPGSTISFEWDDDQKTTQHVVVRDEAGKTDDDFPVVTDVRPVPGSLPKLRFGTHYRLRARVADLAGNSLGPSDSRLDDVNDSGAHTSKAIRYLRHEPVAPPVFVMREKITLAESVEHMVVRSRSYDEDLLYFDDDGTEHVISDDEFNPACKRFVAPPKVSQATSELHGALDPFWHSLEKTFAISLREAGTFDEPGPDVKLVSRAGDAEPYTERLPGRGKGDPLPRGSYTVHDGSTLELPYLPDPLCAGYVFDTGDGRIVLPFDGGGDNGTWPEVTPRELVLHAGPRNMVEANFSDGVNAIMPPGVFVTTRYSSYMTTKSLDLMARYHGLTENARVAVAARDNQHWQMTPWRELTVVHAVNKPLAVPKIATLYQDEPRKPGETAVSLDGKLSTDHIPSTGEMAIFGEWEEIVDDLSDPEGPTISDQLSRGHVFDRSIHLREEGDLAVRNELEVVDGKFAAKKRLHDFGDTKRRIVSYYVKATTRFREYFSNELVSNPDNITVEGEHGLSEAILDIASSKRPDAPKVAYIVPTFHREESDEGRSRSRRGRGLRIYLKRPWYSSGVGELLGIVLKSPESSDSSDMDPYMSDWGVDPAFSSFKPGKSESSRLTPEDFEPVAGMTATTGSQRFLAEHSAQTSERTPVDVLGFEPKFSKEKGLYYVDVVLKGTGYMPMVRFALVRYQPHSEADLHLSKVVRADFAQLMPDRHASIAYTTSKISVNVRGPASRGALKLRNAAGGGYPSGTVMKAFLVRRAAGTEGDLGWLPHGSQVVLQAAIAPSGPVAAEPHREWYGDVSLPFSGDGYEYQLTVTESEIHQADEGSPVGYRVAGDVPAGERIVYFETFGVTKRRQRFFVKPWVVGVKYAIATKVSYAKAEYAALQAHTSQIGWEPPKVPALWQFLSGEVGELPSGTWQPGTSYSAGQEAIYNDITYSCIQPHSAQIGWEPPKVPALWERVRNAGELEWQTQTPYATGDAVNYQGSLYRCRQAHTSQSHWAPSTTYALWLKVD